MLQLIPSLESGGAERSCIDVTAAIVKAGGQGFGCDGGRALDQRDHPRGRHRHFDAAEEKESAGSCGATRNA
jgi:hypothetical protein